MLSTYTFMPGSTVQVGSTGANHTQHGGVSPAVVDNPLAPLGDGGDGSPGSPKLAVSLDDLGLNPEDPNTPLDALGGGPGLSSRSTSGVRVNHGNAATLSAVWKIIGLISGDLAGMKFNVRRSNKTTDHFEVDRRHHANYALSSVANHLTPSIEFFRRFWIHTLLWNQGYAWIDWQDGKVAGIYNLLPDRTRAMEHMETGERYYLTEVDKELRILEPDEVLHVKGMSIQDHDALDMIAYARDDIGRALAANGFVSRFFAGGAQSGGIFELPQGITPKAANTLERGIRQKYEDPNQQFRTMILRDGAKFYKTTIDPRSSQISEVSHDARLAVADRFQCPPSKVGVRNAESKGREHDQLEYVMSCLGPWMGAATGEFELKLLTERDRRTGRRCITHDTSDLLRPDANTYEGILSSRRKNGAITGNEYRKEINYPRSDDPEADKLQNPFTSSAAYRGEEGSGGDESNQPPPERDDEGDSEEGNAENKAALVRSAVIGAAKGFAAYVQNLAKNPDKFRAAVRAGLTLNDDHQASVRSSVVIAGKPELSNVFIALLESEIQNRMESVRMQGLATTVNTQAREYVEWASTLHRLLKP